MNQHFFNASFPGVGLGLPNPLDSRRRPKRVSCFCTKEPALETLVRVYKAIAVSCFFNKTNPYQSTKATIANINGFCNKRKGTSDGNVTSFLEGKGYDL